MAISRRDVLLGSTGALGAATLSFPKPSIAQSEPIKIGCLAAMTGPSSAPTIGFNRGVIFATDDCRGTYETLRAAGVEFTQEPTERFYGTDCALRDPFGNPIRFTQPPDGPIVVPSAEEVQAQR